MKKITIILLWTCFIYNEFNATVKTFVNNSTKNFFVRVYDENNKVIALHLSPGDIQDVFIPCNSLHKIVVIDAKHKSKSLSAMSHNELKKNTFSINNNMIFVINQNSSVKIYKGTSKRDDALRKIDEAFMKQTNLPTIDLSIHTIKSHRDWTTQEVDYNLKYKTRSLASRL